MIYQKKSEKEKAYNQAKTHKNRFTHRTSLINTDERGYLLLSAQHTLSY